MYAIVDIAGKQFKVAKDQFVYAPSVAGETGASVEFDRVLLLGDDNGIEVGTPVVNGAKVTGTILDHGRGDKVIVFKKKRRKGYKKTQGHRQGYSKILIEDILAKGQKASAKKAESKPAPAKEEAPKKETKAKDSGKDDLKKISGIGPVFEKELNAKGYTTFEQISKLSEEDMEKIADIDGLTADLIKSEDWVGQAKELMKK
ncbi:large subunit ribosomal protein L21 [Catalinimonas alkaloidigena]|nr:large subunit ribosomal protein L21 [Catalinimonas alkaloidigena]